jgi:predicted negative regulator of RcsB-dependent stress response
VNPAAFISYAHEDRAAAHEIAFGLQKRGCDVWIDQGELGAGDSIVERLAAGIAEVDFVIAVISKHSVESRWCQKELSLALTQEIDLEGRFGVRRVLPLRLGDVTMPPALRDKLYLDVIAERPGDIVPRLWEDILRHSGPRESDSLSSPADESTASSDAERSYRRGLNLYDKGEVAAARRYLHDASQESHHAAALLLGEILCDQGEIEKAADEWQFAAGSDDKEIASAAVIHYGRILAAYEFSDGALLAGPRGALIGGRGREQAESLWRTAAESGHRDAAWAWLGLGRLLEDPPLRGGEADPAGAETAFENAARSGHSESHAFAMRKLGDMKWRLGKTEEAAAVLKVGAASSDPEWAPFCAFSLGRLYWQEGDKTEAKFWWHEAANAKHSRISGPAREALQDRKSIWRLG